MHYPNATLPPGHHHNAHPSAPFIVNYIMVMPGTVCCVRIMECLDNAYITLILICWYLSTVCVS